MAAAGDFLEEHLKPQTHPVSFWLAISILLIAATMMHPTFASLLSEGIIAALLWSLRRQAWKEGQSRG